MKIYSLYRQAGTFSGPRRQVSDKQAGNSDLSQHRYFHTVLMSYFDPKSNKCLGGSWTHLGRTGKWQTNTCVFTVPWGSQSSKHLGVLTTHVLVDPWSRSLRFFPDRPERLDRDLITRSDLEVQEQGIPGLRETFERQMQQVNGGSSTASESFDIRHWGTSRSLSHENREVMSGESQFPQQQHTRALSSELGPPELDFKPFSPEDGVEFLSYKSLSMDTDSEKGSEIDLGSDDMLSRTFLDDQLLEDSY